MRKALPLFIEGVPRRGEGVKDTTGAKGCGRRYKQTPPALRATSSINRGGVQ